MINKLANRFVQWLNDRSVINEDDTSVYVYGAATLIYTVLSTVGLIALGGALHRVYETLSVIIIFYMNQTNGGGYHASSHSRCFATMLIGLTICLVLCGMHIPVFAIIGMLIFSYSVLLCIPVVLHPNKQYLTERLTLLQNRSRLMTVVQAIIVVTHCALSKTLLYSCTFGVMASAVSRMVGWYNLKRQQS